MLIDTSRIINIYQFNRNPARYIRDVAAGPWVIMDRGKPVAALVHPGEFRAAAEKAGVWKGPDEEHIVPVTDLTRKRSLHVRLAGCGEWFWIISRGNPVAALVGVDLYGRILAAELDA